MRQDFFNDEKTWIKISRDVMAESMITVLDRKAYQADGIMHEKVIKLRERRPNLLIVIIRKERAPKEQEDSEMQHHSQRASGDDNMNPREGQITIGWMKAYENELSEL